MFQRRFLVSKPSSSNLCCREDCLSVIQMKYRYLLYPWERTQSPLTEYMNVWCFQNFQENKLCIQDFENLLNIIQIIINKISILIYTHERGPNHHFPNFANLANIIQIKYWYLFPHERGPNHQWQGTGMYFFTKISWVFKNFKG